MLKVVFSILDLHTTSHYRLIEDAVTMRNGSSFQTFDWSVCPEPVSLSVYKLRVLQSPRVHFSSSHLLSVKKGFMKRETFAFTENKLG